MSNLWITHGIIYKAIEKLVYQKNLCNKYISQISKFELYERAHKKSLYIFNHKYQQFDVWN